MVRYLAISWNARCPEQVQAARLIVARAEQTLPLAQARPVAAGLAIFHGSSRVASDDSYPFANDKGIVLGKLFQRDAPVPGVRACLDRDTSEAIVRTQGRRLLEQYWGRYVAFIGEESSDTQYLIRDPTGGVCCFVAACRGVRLFFSRMEDCLALGLMTFSVDWHHLAGTLAYPFVQTRETDLREVAEVQPGECVALCCGRERRSQLWDPVRIATESPLEEVETAIREVRQVAQRCVADWAACYPRILHLLSGGLDSAAVLGCLRRAPANPRVTCLNHFDASPEGDERGYARLAARQHGYPLVEAEYDVCATRLEAVLDVERTPRVCNFINPLITQRVERRLALEYEADAIFGGGGGDQLFHQGAARYAAADYVHRHALGRRFFETALAVAYSEDLTFWHVCRSALWRGLVRRRANPLSQVGRGRQFLAPQLLEAAAKDSRLALPALLGRGGLCQGKLEHLLALATPAAAGSQWEPQAYDLVEPLLSQPLIELCLRIPTYVLCAGGHDRAIERRAFQGDVPPGILWRRDKGGTTASLTRLLERNAAFIRELLLDGLLMQKGFLMRRKIESFFEHPYSYLTPGAMEIVDDYLSAEVWLRRWER